MSCPERGGLNDYSFAGTRSKILVDRDPPYERFGGDLPKIFSAHFGQLSIIFLWLSGMYFHGARFSNYEAWLSDPTHIGPSAQ
ncbi:hypothetical protein RDABS01_023612 [Bienertia sinuspersici]